MPLIIACFGVSCEVPAGDPGVTNDGAGCSYPEPYEPKFVPEVTTHTVSPFYRDKTSLKYFVTFVSNRELLF